MIKIVKNQEPPSILKTEGQEEKEKLCLLFNKGKKKFEFSNVYKDSAVKIELEKNQHKKCCYCETKYAVTYYGDVEHYRPKNAYQQSKGDPLEKPGYYWLAYDWNNLIRSCGICNNNKRAMFPLKNPNNRAKNHNDSLDKEDPLLINPAEQNPENHITFHEYIAAPVSNSLLGKTTIDVLDLNRPDLTDIRREYLLTFSALLSAKLVLKTKKPVEKSLERDIAYLEEKAQRADKEYAGMFRALMREKKNNPKKYKRTIFRLNHLFESSKK